MAETYPVWRAGMSVTGALVASAQPLVARKTADTTRTSTATPAADPHLQFTVEANAVYVMEGWIKYDGPGNATANLGDITFDWTAPTGTLGEWGAYAPDLATTSETTTIRTISTDITSSRSFGCVGAGTTLTAILSGAVRVGSTAGIYSFDWSQQTSNATGTTVFTDSWIRLQRIA